MARKPSQRGHRAKEEIPPLNIIPVMNLMIILIPALLLMASFVQLAVINVAAPQIGSGEPQERDEDEDDKPPLNLTINVTERGFTIAGTGAVLPSPSEEGGPTVPLTPTGEYDYEGLTRQLVEIKDNFPDESQVIINAEDDIKYNVLIEVMDHSREIDGRLLFDQVVLSAGIA
jgi:biopolymer transport protein TolR